MNIIFYSQMGRNIKEYKNIKEFKYIQIPSSIIFKDNKGKQIILNGTFIIEDTKIDVY